MGVVRGDIGGVDSYVHYFDVLILKQHVVMGLKFDQERVDGNGASRRQGGGRRVSIFQLNLDGVGWGGVEVFDGVLFRFAPNHRTGGAGAFRGSAVGRYSPRVELRQANGNLSRMLVHSEFLMRLVVDAENADAVVLELD